MKPVSRLRLFFSEPLLEKTESISDWYWFLKTQIYYRHFFKEIGAGTRILKPLRLRDVECVTLGDRVLIHKFCWLQTVHDGNKSPDLTIGDGCVIGNFNHITCAGQVLIEEEVLTADRVFIKDHSHHYDNPAMPVLKQGIARGTPVTVGAGSWLGENVAVLSCSIGKHCVIGANSVVTKNIPDYCVAAGAPARVIRRYNPATRTWEPVLREPAQRHETDNSQRRYSNV